MGKIDGLTHTLARPLVVRLVGVDAVETIAHALDVADPVVEFLAVVLGNAGPELQVLLQGTQNPVPAEVSPPTEAHHSLPLQTIGWHSRRLRLSFFARRPSFGDHPAMLPASRSGCQRQLPLLPWSGVVSSV
ncbi:hypothetical protein F0U59_20525 [Archangium gephyra]|nr:hypothetical protein F0U59_20525 [Archangium gephyra]